MVLKLENWMCVSQGFSQSWSVLCVNALVYFSKLHSYEMEKLYPLGHNFKSFLVLTSYFNMTKFQSAWLQLDINLCSYQSNSVIELILLCLAVPFYSHKLFLFSLIHIFDNIKKSVKERLVNQMMQVKPFIKDFTVQ